MVVILEPILKTYIFNMKKVVHKTTNRFLTNDIVERLKVSDIEQSFDN